MILDELFSLKGKVALVTGANSGIGKAIALALAAAGARLVLVARRQPELDTAKSEIESEGGTAATIACDLVDREAISECAARAPSFFGDPDILVQAAGANIRKPMLEITEEDWDQSLKLNLDALFFLAQKLAPAMIAKRWGRIINIASMQSIRAFGNSGAYGASKGAVIQLTRAQAEAWSKYGVNTNAIGPGFFATPLSAAVARDPVRWQAMADKTLIGRNGELDDLRGAAIFLASRASDFVTGQTLFVDGGFSAG
jgi:NAD(P)-dependent dehydrogenase (short-subunit alcohol dehydrogenase family)